MWARKFDKYCQVYFLINNIIQMDNDDALLMLTYFLVLMRQIMLHNLCKWRLHNINSAYLSHMHYFHMNNNLSRIHYSHVWLEFSGHTSSTPWPKPFLRGEKVPRNGWLPTASLTLWSICSSRTGEERSREKQILNWTRDLIDPF